MTSVVREGGRLDPWTFCLADGNRPAGLVAFDPDATVVQEEGEGKLVAWSTCIERPGGAGIGEGTLLATQKWERGGGGGGGEGEGGGEGWRLALHSTIPYTSGSSAGGLLRCDSRGCVALLATRERSTSGGLKSLVDQWI